MSCKVQVVQRQWTRAPRTQSLHYRTLPILLVGVPSCARRRGGLAVTRKDATRSTRGRLRVCAASSLMSASRSRQWTSATARLWSPSTTAASALGVFLDLWN